MTAYIVRRLWQMIPTMLGVVLLVFFLFNWVGGDPAYVLAGKISNQEQIDNIRRQLGVDQPFYVQLGIFIKQIVTADFGASWSTNVRYSRRLGAMLTARPMRIGSEEYTTRFSMKLSPQPCTGNQPSL